MMTCASPFSPSADRGFLRPKGWDGPVFKGAAAETIALAHQLPDLLLTGNIRRLLKNRLPDTLGREEIAALDDAESRWAFLYYGFLAQSYIWGEADPADHLPRQIALPLALLADRLGQPPILGYSGYIMDNFVKLDPDGPFILENLRVAQRMAGGQDEAWFILVHVVIEQAAGPGLAAIDPTLQAARDDDASKVEQGLAHVADSWGAMQRLFNRMKDQCDPQIFFDRVRPFIFGWRDNPALPNGVIYEGVDAFGGQPQQFRGQTGAQSSIVPAMDAFLGIGHADDPLRDYLDDLHSYRTRQEKHFIDYLRQGPGLRPYIRQKNCPRLTDAYNGVLEAMAKFRSLHLGYAARYINDPGKSKAATVNGNPGAALGTGGTPFMPYLKKHRDETKNAKL